jgi:hypothetical protein
VAFELALVVDHLGKEAGQHTNLGMHHRPRLSCKSSESQESRSSSITLPVFMPLDSPNDQASRALEACYPIHKVRINNRKQQSDRDTYIRVTCMYIHRGGATLPLLITVQCLFCRVTSPLDSFTFDVYTFHLAAPKGILSPYLSFDPARLMYLLDRNLRKAT